MSAINRIAIRHLQVPVEGVSLTELRSQLDNVQNNVTEPAVSTPTSTSDGQTTVVPVKRKRGRPRKNPLT